MTTGIRRSPLHAMLLPESPQWSELHGMQAAVRLPGDDSAVGILLADASCLPRMGVKGPQAESWLRGQGVSVPEGVNTWTRTVEGVLVARLARSEFFLEEGLGGNALERWRNALEPAPGVYPVLRQDAALALAGKRLNDLLVQTCNVDFTACAAGGRAVVMTSMVGVSVLVIRDDSRSDPLLRIWCDGTFGAYLWETLLAIARAEGGGAAGLGKLFPDRPGS
jgi:sarcosine oxidase subunit gamma